MRSIRHAALAIGLVMVTALIGSGTAAAEDTVLCKASQEPCQPQNVHQAPTAVKATLEKEAIFEISGSKVSCAESSITGETEETVETVEESEGEALKGTITAFTFAKCKVVGLGSSCTLSTTNLPYASEGLATKEGDGTITTKSSGKGNPTATINCAGIIECTFSESEVQFAFDGGETAKVLASGVLLESISGGCSEAKMTATYVVQNPAGTLNLRRTRTVLCEASEARCSGPNTNPSGTVVESATPAMENATLAGGAVSISCAASSIDGKTAAEAAQPLPFTIETLSFEGCIHAAAPCTVTVLSGTLGWIRATGSGNGSLTIMAPQIRFICSKSGLDCVYKKTRAILSATGSLTAAVFKAEGAQLDLFQTNQGTCPATLQWTGKYVFSAPTAVFFTG